MAQIKLTVDTGAITVPIYDGKEKIGTFRFNPADPDIARRLNHVEKHFEGIDIPDDPGEEEFFAITDDIKKQFDYLLNYNASDEIFSKCSPLTLLGNGDFFMENVLDGIGTILDTVLTERAAKKQEQIDAITAQYAENE